jgi:membrane associated rhomboid family serine protease
MPVQSKPEPMSPAVPEIPKNELPPEAAKLAAIHQVELIAERAKRENQFNAVHLPLWQKVLAIIGMPVEDDSESLKSFPWCTTLLALATMACSIGFIYFGDFRSFEYYGFVPRDYDRDGGLTFLSSFLIHGGWVHLLGNMYFLFVFGQVVEDKIGWLGFLVLVILSTAGGNLCTLYFDPVSDIPNVGASGGIAGILLFYGFTFPRKRIVFYALWMPRLIRVPAWAALGLWVLLQLFGASFQVAGMTSVSYSSHLGGLSTGFLCWLAWRLFHSTAGPGKVE